MPIWLVIKPMSCFTPAAFKPSTNAQLIPIRQLELFKDRRKVESDDKLSAADKTRQLAEIDQKLAALKK